VWHGLLLPQGFAGELDFDKEMGALEHKNQPNRLQGKGKDRLPPGKNKALTNKQRAAKDAKYGEYRWKCLGTS